MQPVSCPNDQVPLSFRSGDSGMEMSFFFTVIHKDDENVIEDRGNERRVEAQHRSKQPNTAAPVKDLYV